MSLYRQLLEDGFIPWLDKKDLLPGQDWEQEISKAVRESDVVLVCVSSNSVSKAGFVQKEIRYALDVADEQPEGTIFLIPIRLEEINMPKRLSRLHWVNYFEPEGYQQLTRALRSRASKQSSYRP